MHSRSTHSTILTMLTVHASMAESYTKQPGRLKQVPTAMSTAGGNGLSSAASVASATLFHTPLSPQLQWHPKTSSWRQTMDQEASTPTGPSHNPTTPARQLPAAAHQVRQLLLSRLGPSLPSAHHHTICAPRCDIHCHSCRLEPVQVPLLAVSTTHQIFWPSLPSCLQHPHSHTPTTEDSATCHAPAHPLSSSFRLWS